MKVLIRREIDEMLSSSLRESLVIYSIFSVGMILLSWVLGPKVFGFVNMEKMNGVFAVIIFMLINGCLDFNLKLESCKKRVGVNFAEKYQSATNQ